MPDRIHGVCREFGLWMKRDFPASVTHYFTILKIGLLQKVRLAHQIDR